MFNVVRAATAARHSHSPATTSSISAATSPRFISKFASKWRSRIAAGHSSSSSIEGNGHGPAQWVDQPLVEEEAQQNKKRTSSGSILANLPLSFFEPQPGESVDALRARVAAVLADSEADELQYLLNTASSPLFSNQHVKHLVTNVAALQKVDVVRKQTSAGVTRETQKLRLSRTYEKWASGKVDAEKIVEERAKALAMEDVPEKDGADGNEHGSVSENGTAPHHLSIDSEASDTSSEDSQDGTEVVIRKRAKRAKFLARKAEREERLRRFLERSAKRELKQDDTLTDASTGNHHEADQQSAEARVRAAAEQWATLQLEAVLASTIPRTPKLEPSAATAGSGSNGMTPTVAMSAQSDDVTRSAISDGNVWGMPIVEGITARSNLSLKPSSEAHNHSAAAIERQSQSQSVRFARHPSGELDEDGVTRVAEEILGQHDTNTKTQHRCKRQLSTSMRQQPSDDSVLIHTREGTTQKRSNNGRDGRRLASSLSTPSLAHGNTKHIAGSARAGTTRAASKRTQQQRQKAETKEHGSARQSRTNQPGHSPRTVDQPVRSPPRSPPPPSHSRHNSPHVIDAFSPLLSPHHARSSPMPSPTRHLVHSIALTLEPHIHPPAYLTARNPEQQPIRRPKPGQMHYFKRTDSNKKKVNKKQKTKQDESDASHRKAEPVAFGSSAPQRPRVGPFSRASDDVDDIMVRTPYSPYRRMRRGFVGSKSTGRLGLDNASWRSIHSPRTSDTPASTKSTATNTPPREDVKADHPTDAIARGPDAFPATLKPRCNMYLKRVQQLKGTPFITMQMNEPSHALRDHMLSSAHNCSVLPMRGEDSHSRSVLELTRRSVRKDMTRNPNSSSSPSLLFVQRKRKPTTIRLPSDPSPEADLDILISQLPLVQSASSPKLVSHTHPDHVVSTSASGSSSSNLHSSSDSFSPPSSSNSTLDGIDDQPRHSSSARHHSTSHSASHVSHTASRPNTARMRVPHPVAIATFVTDEEYDNPAIASRALTSNTSGSILIHSRLPARAPLHSSASHRSLHGDVRGSASMSMTPSSKLQSTHSRATLNFSPSSSMSAMDGSTYGTSHDRLRQNSLTGSWIDMMLHEVEQAALHKSSLHENSQQGQDDRNEPSMMSQRTPIERQNDSLMPDEESKEQLDTGAHSQSIVNRLVPTWNQATPPHRTTLSPARSPSRFSSPSPSVSLSPCRPPLFMKLRMRSSPSTSTLRNVNGVGSGVVQ